MLKWILNALKIFIILGIITVALSTLGDFINSLGFWTWLTYIFSFTHYALSIFSWFWDTETLWRLLGISIQVALYVYGFVAVMWAIRWWKEVN